VPVDAIPDIGENQQIIFTEWMGRSPQDIEDQITYPLTSALLGIPELPAYEALQCSGFSSIYVIFDEDIEYYWSRSADPGKAERSASWTAARMLIRSLALMQRHWDRFSGTPWRDWMKTAILPGDGTCTS
jgi:hypothetical protein